MGVIQDMRLNDTHKGRGAFSKIKELLRRVRASTREAQEKAMGQALSAISARDAHSFFEHAGYRPVGQLL